MEHLFLRNSPTTENLLHPPFFAKGESAPLQPKADQPQAEAEEKGGQGGFICLSSIVLVCLITAVGCATPAADSSTYPLPAIHSFSLPPTTPVIPNGMYHTVQKGETLWRIARAYQIPAEEIVRINRLPDVKKLKTGQRIFIPGATKILENPENPIEETTLSGVPANESFIWPAKGRILSYFSSTKEKSLNKGIDIALQPGAAVAAARSGKVSFAHERLKGLGKIIIVDHGDGYQTVYGHLSEILVKPGDRVDQGMVIAKSGSTGRNLGASLHFEVREDHQPKNPLHYLP